MWAEIVLKHDHAAGEQIKVILTQCFDESYISSSKAINVSERYRSLDDEKKKEFCHRILYANFPYYDALLIFIRSSETDFRCQLEFDRSYDMVDAMRICNKTVNNIDDRMRRNKMKLKEIEVQFYEGDVKLGIRGELDSIINYIWCFIKEQGFLLSGFTAIIAILIWLLNRGISAETLYLSFVTLVVIAILVFLMAFIKSITKRKKLIFFIEP